MNLMNYDKRLNLRASGQSTNNSLTIIRIASARLTRLPGWPSAFR